MNTKDILVKDLLVSIVLSFLYELYSEFLFKDLFEPIYCTLLAIFCAIATTTIIIGIFYCLYEHLYFVRYLIHPLAKFEGFWISYTGIPERPVSTFEIRYDAVSRRYIYFGKAYNSKFVYQGDWRSQGDLVIENDGFRFYATGHFVDKNGDLQSTESSGYFVLRKYKSEYTADGYIVDWCSNNYCFKVNSEKVTKKYLKNKIMSDDLDLDAIKKLVAHYSTLYSNTTP